MATLNLDKILPTLEENSKTVRNTYISYLAAATFIWVTIESVTHRMLLIPDERLTLPVIQVQIPVVGFFATAPALLLMFQLYFQIHVYNFARDLARERDGLQAEQIQELRNRLPGNLFTWNFLYPENHYTVFGFLNHILVSFTFFWYGAFVLLRTQWTFLPYHYEIISHWEHRIIVLSSVIISTCFAFQIWALRNGKKDGFFSILRLIGNRLKIIKNPRYPYFNPSSEYQGWQKFVAMLHYIFGSIITLTGLYFFISMSGFILSIPFNQDENERTFSDWTWIPETILVCAQQTIFENFSEKNSKPLYEPLTLSGGGNLELEGGGNLLIRVGNPCKNSFFLISQLLENLASNTKRLPNHFLINDVIDRNLQLAEAKLALAPSDTMKAALIQVKGNELFIDKENEFYLDNFGRLDLKGRHLEFADFGGTDLRKADLRNAFLKGANLREAQLNGANFESARLQNADLRGAQYNDLQFKKALIDGTQF